MNYKITHNTKESFDLAFMRVCELLRKKNYNKANQNEINEETVADKLLNIINNKNEYLAKKMNMKNFSYQNTWNNINQKIISVINEN